MGTRARGRHRDVAQTRHLEHVSVLRIVRRRVVPAGTPPAVIGRLKTEVGKALADPTARAKMMQSANEPVGASPEQLAKQFRDDYEKYGRLVKELNIKLG
jgi:tripartite-type tricarboxylate transporter receptor subunit TctC